MPTNTPCIAKRGSGDEAAPEQTGTRFADARPSKAISHALADVSGVKWTFI
jgi:hypothetical protein